MEFLREQYSDRFCSCCTSTTCLRTFDKVVDSDEDISIFYRAQTWEQLRTNVDDDLQIILSWLHNNKLTLNIQKSSYISVPFSYSCDCVFWL